MKLDFSRIFAGGFGAITESWVRDRSPESCLSSVEIYDPDTNTWSLGPDLPVPLCGMGVVKYYGTIYVIGGNLLQQNIGGFIYLVENNF